MIVGLRLDVVHGHRTTCDNGGERPITVDRLAYLLLTAVNRTEVPALLLTVTP